MAFKITPYKKNRDDIISNTDQISDNFFHFEEEITTVNNEVKSVSNEVTNLTVEVQKTDQNLDFVAKLRLLNEAHDVVPFAQTFTNRIRVPDVDNPQAYLTPTISQDVVNKKYVDQAVSRAKDEVKDEIEKEIGDDKFVFAKLSEKDNGVVGFRQHFTNRITVPDVSTPIPGVISISPEDVVNKSYIDKNIATCAKLTSKEKQSFQGVITVPDEVSGDPEDVVNKRYVDSKISKFGESEYLRKKGGDFYSWDLYPIAQDAERQDSGLPEKSFYQKYLKWGGEKYDEGHILWTRDVDVSPETLYNISVDPGTGPYSHLKGQCLNLGTAMKFIEFRHTEREGYTCKPKFEFSFDPVIPITGVDIPDGSGDPVPFMIKNFVLKGQRSDYSPKEGVKIQYSDSQIAFFGLYFLDDFLDALEKKIETKIKTELAALEAKIQDWSRLNFLDLKGQNSMQGDLQMAFNQIKNVKVDHDDPDCAATVGSAHINLQNTMMADIYFEMHISLENLRLDRIDTIEIGTEIFAWQIDWENERVQRLSMYRDVTDINQEQHPVYTRYSYFRLKRFYIPHDSFKVAHNFPLRSIDMVPTREGEILESLHFDFDVGNFLNGKKIDLAVSVAIVCAKRLPTSPQGFHFYINCLADMSLPWAEYKEPNLASSRAFIVGRDFSRKEYGPKFTRKEGSISVVTLGIDSRKPMIYTLESNSAAFNEWPSQLYVDCPDFIGRTARFQVFNCQFVGLWVHETKRWKQENVYENMSKIQDAILSNFPPFYLIQEQEDGEKGPDKTGKNCIWPVIGCGKKEGLPNPWCILQEILGGLETLQKDCSHPTTLANMCRQSAKAIKYCENATMAYQHHQQDTFEIEIALCKGMVEIMWKEAFEPREMQFVPEAQQKVLKDRIRSLLSLLGFFNENKVVGAINKFVESL